MCRLYAFKSTEKTKVECTLVHAQNALMTQSRSDLSGTDHTHGWGLATYEGKLPHLERQAWAAYHGEHFARAAAKIYSTTVIAHVRRATVGVAAIENTHPFVFQQWTFAHNGTVPAFDQVRPRLLAAMTPAHREAIQGQTDSEHLFRYALSLMEQDPGLSMQATLRKVVLDVSGWAEELAKGKPVGLNLILSDGESIVGSRLGRTLYMVARTGVYDCEICGFPHIHHMPRSNHRAVVVASEPISHEGWQEIEDRSIWEIDPQARIRVSPLQP